MHSVGLITWVIIAVVVLAVIGLGVGTFYSGILQGAQTVGNNPTVKDATGEAKEFAGNVTQKSASN
jgi:flagellar basal body-associated protein FliL